jgi:putative membrane protein
MKLVARWLISAVAIVVATYLLRDGIHVENFQTALLASLVLGVINVTLKPLLFLLTLPITVLTLGLFALVLNALFIMLTDVLVPGFDVDGFWWAVLFSFVLTGVNYILNKLIE